MCSSRYNWTKFAPNMTEGFFPLTIKKLVRETADATTFYFDIPAELKDTFVYSAGQYLNEFFILQHKQACVTPFKIRMFTLIPTYKDLLIY